jgi:ABC-type transport system involved in cytochrome bd biosynthesis fused ATPase/permease subunit
MKDYQANLWIDQQHPATLHSIEQSRTIVLQDSHMDYRSTIFSMITDIDEDTAKEQINCEFESLVWHFLRLVDMEDFVRHDLNGNLDEPLENKLSGGQKTRLLLARALFRAHNRQSSMLILDEPDKGLPAETTVSIIENIIEWYRPKGILFLTLHTEKAHALHFDQVLNIENGNITKVK